MSDSQEKLFLHWSDSVQKFDYYMTGLIGASVVYLIKEHHAVRIGMNPSTIELAAIFSLVVSLFAGITRMERIVTILRVTHDIVPRDELLKKLRSRTQNETVLSETTLQPLSEEDLVSKQAHLSDVVKRAKEGRDRHSRMSSLSYTVRNIAFAVGILLLFIAKIAEPYFTL